MDISGKLIKDNKCLGGEFAVIEELNYAVNGTSHSAKVLSYPDGFTKDNCIVVSAHRENTSSRVLKEYNKAFLDDGKVYNTIEITLANNGINLYCKNVSTAGQQTFDVQILLFRYK